MSAFDDLMKNQGSELVEKFARDSGTLGALITRHIAEFDRTVKTFGGEIVDRLGQRTQDITDSLKNYVDTFDTRLTSNSGEMTASLDQRLLQFETTLGNRVATLDTSLDDKMRNSTGDGRTHQGVRLDVDGRLKSLEVNLRQPRQVGDRDHRQPARTLATSLTDGAAQAIHSIDSRLTQLTTSLTDGRCRRCGGRSAHQRRHRHHQQPHHDLTETIAGRTTI